MCLMSRRTGEPDTIHARRGTRAESLPKLTPSPLPPELSPRLSCQSIVIQYLPAPGICVKSNHCSSTRAWYRRQNVSLAGAG